MRRKFEHIRIPKSHFLLISMASLFSLSLLIVFLSLSLSSPSSAASRKRSSTAAISQACHATRFPKICFESLTKGSVNLPSNPTAIQIIQAAISVSAVDLKKAQSMVQTILRSSSGNPNRSVAAINCAETLDMSLRRTDSTSLALVRGPRNAAVDVKDARAWVSAAVHMQYACWSGLSYANDTVLVAETMAFLNATVVPQASNALSMIASLDAFGTDLARWVPPKTERDGFWLPVGAWSEFKPGGVPSGLTANVTVCKACKRAKNSRYFETVQDAVKAAPSNGSGLFVIQIKAGIYEENVRVSVDQKNLVFLGDGVGKTVITGSSFVQPGISTYNTATLAVNGDGFMMTGVTVENTAGPDAHQAVAFRSESDHSVIDSCEFLGNQDTLYADTARQFYTSSVFVGNVDFIFGNSATVFHNCTILVRPRQSNPASSDTNAVTAQGRVDPAQSTGFVFDGCLVNGTKEYMDLYRQKPGKHKTYLGRPWKLFSRTVFVRCTLEALIRPEGWLPWKQDFALKTLYYGEFANKGPGAGLSERVNWSSQIPQQYVNTYSVANFIQGDQWIPPSSS